MEVTNNEELRNSILMLNEIKEKTGASYVRISTDLLGAIAVQIDWEDNSHIRKVFTPEEVIQANFEILPIVIEYANREHEMLLEGKL